MAVVVASRPKAFDCRTCEERCCNSTTAASYDVWTIAGLGGFRVCPKPQISQASDRYIALYHHYRNNNLAHTGAILDQPEPYLQAMELIDHHLNREQEQ